MIVVLNWNGYTDTLECLHSLDKISYPNYGIVVVDNGSSNDSVQKIREAFPKIPILEMDQNHGFAGGNNPGIEWALDHHAEWVLLLNNDTVVAPDFLEHLMAAAKEKPLAGVLGGKILRYQTDVIDHLGGYWDEKKGEFFSAHTGSQDHPYFEMEAADYVCGACMLIRKECLERVGFLEPRFFLFWEETDFCYRAQRAGWEVWTAPKAKIWHKVSSSFIGGKPHMHYFWWRSRLLWMARNCSIEEKRALYRQIIVPQAIKMARYFLIKSILFVFDRQEKKREEIRRYRAGCRGIFDYWRGSFGNCPHWLVKETSHNHSR